jgi:hypothetical protein
MHLNMLMVVRARRTPVSMEQMPSQPRWGGGGYPPPPPPHTHTHARTHTLSHGRGRMRGRGRACAAFANSLVGALHESEAIGALRDCLPAGIEGGAPGRTRSAAQLSYEYTAVV